jgi:hypothetical protein
MAISRLKIRPSLAQRIECRDRILRALQPAPRALAERIVGLVPNRTGQRVLIVRQGLLELAQQGILQRVDTVGDGVSDRRSSANLRYCFSGSSELMTR